ncbi:MAG: hypothetical protein ACI30R_00710 [Sodaliphilus sp.]
MVAYLKACTRLGGIRYRHFDAIPFRWRSIPSHLHTGLHTSHPDGMAATPHFFASPHYTSSPRHT